ncbi:MAG: Flp pilus assembly protein CpaB [Actinomycetota bacterium]
MLRRRWPIASKVLVAFAVLLGALAFLMVRGYQERVEAVHPEVGSPVATVTATTDLARGTLLTDEMLQTSSVPDEFAPPGAIVDAGAIVGRVLTADIDEGEMLTRSRLAEPRIGPVAALVPEGLRAVVVPSGVPPGTIHAGDRVEVYATYGGGRPHTELVATGLEVVRILTEGTSGAGGIGGTTSGDAGVALVLLVDGEAATRLAYARAFGQLLIAILGPEASPAA